MRSKAAVSVAVLVVAIAMIAGCDSPDSPVFRQLIGWAVGSPVDGYGTIIKTTDGGDTWRRQGSAAVIPDVEITNVSAVDAQNVWAVGANSDGYGVILRTADGGRTWIRQAGLGEIPDVAFYGVSAVHPDIAWVAGDGGTVLRTLDGGRTWQRRDTGFPDAGFGAISAAGRDTAWAFGNDGNPGGQRQLILNTGDGGATWTPQGSPTAFSSDMLIDGHAVDENVAWCVGTDYTVGYTRTGGVTWGNLPPVASWQHLNGVCGIGAELAWVAADYNTMFRTTDAGRTWQQFAPDTRHGTTFVLGVTAINANIAWFVGTDVQHLDDQGFILRTTDGGATWTDIVCPVNAGLRRVSFVGAAH